MCIVCRLDSVKGVCFPKRRCLLRVEDPTSKFWCLGQGTVALLYIVLDLSHWRGRPAARKKSTPFSESRKDYPSKCILRERIHNLENECHALSPSHTFACMDTTSKLHLWEKIAIVLLCTRRLGTGGGRCMFCACSETGRLPCSGPGLFKFPLLGLTIGWPDMLSASVWCCCSHCMQLFVGLQRRPPLFNRPHCLVTGSIKCLSHVSGQAYQRDGKFSCLVLLFPVGLEDRELLAIDLFSKQGLLLGSKCCHVLLVWGFRVWRKGICTAVHVQGMWVVVVHVRIISGHQS